MKTRKSNKYYATVNHAKTRFKERCGFDVTGDELKNLVHQIQNHKATFVKRTSQRLTLFRVCIRGYEYTVVYDKKRKLIVTVLY